MLNLAVEPTELATDPAPASGRKTQGKVVWRRDPKRTFRLTREKVETVADAMPPQYRFAVLLSAGTGVRFGELAALRRSDLTVLRDDTIGDTDLATSAICQHSAAEAVDNLADRL